MVYIACVCLWQTAAFKSLWPWAIDSLSHHAKKINTSATQDSQEPRVNSCPSGVDQACQSHLSSPRAFARRDFLVFSWCACEHLPGTSSGVSRKALKAEPTISLPPDCCYGPVSWKIAEGQRVLNTSALMMRVTVQGPDVQLRRRIVWMMLQQMERLCEVYLWYKTAQLIILIIC